MGKRRRSEDYQELLDIVPVTNWAERPPPSGGTGGAQPDGRAIVWCAIDDPDLRVVDFDNCSMVFNPTTWDTHYVSPLIGAVLGLLRESAYPVESIASELAANPDDVDALAEQVLSALSQLATFGLVTSVDPCANP